MLYRYLLDKEVSILKKILVAGMIIYVFSPLDLIPEAVLGFGFIDDAMLAIFVISSISKELDKYVSIKEDIKRKEDMGKVIDFAEYEIRDKKDDES
ncbi:YkvA family protein [Wukongibacter sp. M2B1]|uniref:YkvA family protein n=1 Tax=Wukongibacter sp. M2B1 TaxID=3088895 RepID=UPI003D79AB17